MKAFAVKRIQFNILVSPLSSSLLLLNDGCQCRIMGSVFEIQFSQKAQLEVQFQTKLQICCCNGISNSAIEMKKWSKMNPDRLISGCLMRVALQRGEMRCQAELTVVNDRVIRLIGGVRFLQCVDICLSRVVKDSIRWSVQGWVGRLHSAKPWDHERCALHPTLETKCHTLPYFTLPNFLHWGRQSTGWCWLTYDRRVGLLHPFQGLV